jgi:hypothetical protein
VARRTGGRLVYALSLLAAVGCAAPGAWCAQVHTLADSWENAGCGLEMQLTVDKPAFVHNPAAGLSLLSPGVRWRSGELPPNFLINRTTGIEHQQRMFQPLDDYRSRRMFLNGVYGAAYAAAARIGTRFGLEERYRIVRLESAYAHDFVGHIFATYQIALAMTSLNRWAGYTERQSRNRGVWWGAFTVMAFMEVLNGFMPTVRFDPLDLPANFIGAWLADGGLVLAERYPHLKRFSLQVGFKSLERIAHNQESSNVLGNMWHDYPNNRFGLGYDIGPAGRPWITLFATYSITSMKIKELRNRFGVGVEFNVVGWFSPLIMRIPGGGTFMRAYNWVNDRLMIPYCYVQLFHVDAPPFSSHPPFQESY